MSLSFAFSVPTRVQFGAGVRQQVAEVLASHGWRRVAVVLDHNLQQVDRVKGLIRELASNAETLVVPCEISEPTYDSLDAARTPLMGRELDAVVAIGGGSALDMGKAMAGLVHNTEPAITYRGFDKLTAPVLPIIAVPTTAGTGSEVTPNASFVDTREQRKLGINGEAVRPRYAFLDPELTLSCPPRATISAAVDSLVHATEAYAARKSTAIARLFARDGFARVFKALPTVVQRPDDLAQREEVMLGAFLAGVALMHSGTGPAAAMSYPLGVHYGVPHGFAGGTFLPFVVSHNVAHGYEDYADLYDGIAPSGSGSRRDRGAALAASLRSLMRDLDVFQDPEALGLTAARVDRFVADTLELKGALEQNPVSFGADEIRATLEALAAERRPARG